jgi:hypothetical protein
MASSGEISPETALYPVMMLQSQKIPKYFKCKEKEEIKKEQS